MSEREEDVITNIRAIIISCKGGLRVNDVESDYWEAFGQKVPLKEMGYKNLRDFFERNPSEFYLFDDKVDVITKSSSAHIRSLVLRQKSSRSRSRRGVNAAQPKKRQSVTSFGKPSRFSRENSASTSRESARYEKKAGPPEIIKLRKPKASSTSELAHHGLFSKTSLALQEHVKQIVLKNEAMGKKAKPDITSRTQLQGFGTDLSNNTNFTITFENIPDIPGRTSSQSRLVRLKSNISKELKTSCIDEGSGKTHSDGKDVPFDLKSLSFTPPGKEYGSTASQKTIKSLQPKSTHQQSVKYTHQKAQARIAQLQQSMQSLMHNMNVPSNEVNNNKMDKPDSKIEKSNDQPIKPMHSFEKPANKESQNDPLETVIDNAANDSTLCPPNQKVTMTDNSMYVTLLKELCNSRGFYDPSYKIIVREQANEPKCYICKVQIEDYLQMSSYPIETQDPLAAKELAAKKMYNYCVSDETFRKRNENEEKLISRIMEIVSATYGVWSDKLPILYSNWYKETLPDDWFKLISASPLFEIENYDANRCIIRKKTERSIIDIETLQRFKAIEIRESESRNLPELELPKTSQWGIYITNVNNSDEIWCRLIGDKYSDAYDAMMTKLELQPLERKSAKPKIGGLYGMKNSGIWFRVKIMELVNESEGLVFYVDTGDREVVKLSELYEPEECFLSIAPQAVTFSLFELGCFSDDDEITSYITEKLLGNTYIGEIITEMGSDYNSRRIITLWDTSTEQDVNVNQIFINNIIKSIKAPSLPYSFHIRDVVVTSITDSGEIHVQTEQKSVNRLNCIIRNKIKSMDEEHMRRKPDNTIGTEILYLTKCSSNGNFCRVKLTEIKNAAMIEVSFIDYGFIQKKPISELIHLEKSSILQAIPAQAIKVKLGNITFINQEVMSKLREQVLNQVTLMKLVSMNHGDIPLVEFFKRSKGDNLLRSINMKISDETDQKDCSTPIRKKSVVFGLEKVFPKNLPAPDIPEIGQHFEVFVTLASSPDLFIVQPLASRTQFMKMMNELQQMFVDKNSSMPMGEDIIIGELYAVLHPDGNWYRGCAQAVVGSYNYSIYMCDFGDCIMVTKDKLMLLPDKFKFFPYQAIRATLMGIPAEHKDWTPLDCFTFHNLVVEKCFVSTIMAITKDDKNPNYVSLSLILTDTSGEEDVYIHKVLTEMKNETSDLMGF